MLGVTKKLAPTVHICSVVAWVPQPLRYGRIGCSSIDPFVASERGQRVVVVLPDVAPRTLHVPSIEQLGNRRGLPDESQVERLGIADGTARVQCREIEGPRLPAHMALPECHARILCREVLHTLSGLAGEVRSAERPARNADVIQREVTGQILRCRQRQFLINAAGGESRPSLNEGSHWPGWSLSKPDVPLEAGFGAAIDRQPALAPRRWNVRF